MTDQPTDPATPTSFGFTVEHWGQPDDADHGWMVSLPHQCERWHITGDQQDGVVYHHQAIEEMEAFVAEATDALWALRRREQWP